MITIAKPESVTERVLGTLETLHHQRRTRRVAQTSLWTLAIAINLCGLAVILDGLIGWWSVPIRVAISLAVLITISFFSFVAMRWALSRDEDETLASAADSHTPMMQERLQTLVAAMDVDAGADRIMLSRVALETDGLLDEFDPNDAATESSLRGPLAMVVAGIVMWGGIAISFTGDTGILVGRMLVPTANWTRCQLEGIPGDQVVARGEAFIMNLIGKRSTGDTVTLERRIQKQGSSGEAARTITETIESVSAKREFDFGQRRVEESHDYRISTGDLRTAWHRVTVARRPRVRGVRLQVTPPGYSKLPTKTYDRMPNRLTVIEGSHVKVIATYEGDTEFAMVKVEDSAPRTMLATKRNEFSTSIHVQQETKIAIELTESHGLTNKNPPKCHFLTRPDLPPSVRIHSPSPDQTVRPDDTIELKFKAKDDVGLARARLVVQIEDEDDPSAPAKLLESRDIPVPTSSSDSGQPLKEWNGKTQLDLSKFELSEGQTLTYRIEVFDTKQSELLEAHETDTPAIAGSSDTQASPQTKGDETESASQAGENVASNSSKDTPATDNQSAGNPIEGNRSSSSADRASSSLAEPAVPSTDLAAGPAPSDTKPDASNPSSPQGESTDSIANATPANEKALVSSTPADDSVASASNRDTPPDSPPTNSSTPPSPLTTRRLDLPQPSTSQPMRLNVSETVGSFVSEKRRKSEVAIAAAFRDVEASLKSARESLAIILNSESDADQAWPQESVRAASDASNSLSHATERVRELIGRTKETPYAFIGLQLAEIAHTHIIPASKDSKSSLETGGETRMALVTASRQQTLRALERLQNLYKTYVTAKEDFEVAKNVQQVEKLYRVYLEDALAELERATREGDGTPGLSRTMAELELDEEYLTRLKEVLEMRRDLRAELARILADDPRLMRRYFQNFGNNGRSIRDQLYDLARQQRAHFDLATRYSNATEANNDSKALTVVLSSHASAMSIDAMNLVQNALEIEENFENWLPLDDRETPAIATARDSFLDVSAAAGEVTTAFESDLAARLFSGDDTIHRKDLSTLISAASTAMDDLAQSLDLASATLAELGVKEPNLVENATRRIIQLTQSHAAVSRWSTAARMIASENYAGAVGVAQLDTTNRTHDLTEKLTGLQRELARQLDPDSQMLPQSIADACDQLLESLDREIEPLQLASIRALQQSQWPRATQRLQASADGLDQACRLADDLLRKVIERLDQLPPDPLQDLLEDPTLDEILAQLEDERQMDETLGIPSRPTNLQIINDWANGKQGPGGAARARLIAMIRQSMAQQQKKQSQRMEKIKKALMQRHASRDNHVVDDSKRKSMVFGWNVLRSQLATGLLQESDGQPPESYRPSIDRYFEIISSLGRAE